MKIVSKIFSASLITVLTAVPVLSYAAARGGNSGGGGTSCQKPGLNGGNPILLDLALAYPTLQDSQGEHVAVTNIAKTIGFDTFNFKSTKAFQFALSKLAEWKKAVPELGTMDSTFDNLQMFITPYRMNKPSRVSVDETSICQSENLRGVIFYVNGRAFIATEDWNKLGFYSQAAAFIHEGLRQRQLLHQDEISDKTLQEVTAKILFGYPSRDEVILNSGLFAKPTRQKNELELQFDKLCAHSRPSLKGLSSSDVEVITPAIQKIQDVCAKNLPQINVAGLSGTQMQLSSIHDELFNVTDAMPFRSSTIPIREVVFTLLHEVGETMMAIFRRDFSSRDAAFTDSGNALDTGSNEKLLIQMVQDYLNGSVSGVKSVEADKIVQTLRGQIQELVQTGKIQ